MLDLRWSVQPPFLCWALVCPALDLSAVRFGSTAPRLGGVGAVFAVVFVVLFMQCVALVLVLLFLLIRCVACVGFVSDAAASGGSPSVHDAC